jgi:3-hydroxyisobutyrate dehydrogenase
MSAIAKVGFVGLGRMGAPMAGHLVKAGFAVTGYDIRPEAVSAFIREHGGKGAGSIAELAAESPTLITMLPDHHVVREVVLADGSGGAAAALPRHAVVIDMSTSDPVATRTLAAKLEAQGIALLDAPVMGGVIFAKDASLDVMVGGDKKTIERCRPLFTAMGRSVIECGPVGAGHALKALANYVNASALATAIEALTIGKRYGLDAKFMAESLVSLCAGRNHPIEKKILPHVLTRAYGTGMSAGLIAKDVRIALDTAHALGAYAPLAEKVAELWACAVKTLGPDVDQTEIVRYWEEASGIEL